MILRRPHDLADLFRDGRARAGLSQSELAERVGASRQWVSLVETGRTGVSFDLVLAALQALGYRVYVDSPPEAPGPDAQEFESPSHDPSQRKPLTRDGRLLGQQTPRRRKRSAGGAEGDEPS